MSLAPFPARIGAALVWQTIQLGGVKGIYLVRLLVLARLLTPADFGLLAIASVVVATALTLTDFGLVAALVQRGEDDEHGGHYDAAWTAGLLRGVMVTVLLAASAPFVARLFEEPAAAAIIAALALRPVFEAAGSIRVAELTRKLQFRALAAISLTTVAVETVIAIALARHIGVWGVVCGSLAGALVGAALSYVLAPHWPRLSLARDGIRPLVHFGRWLLLTGMVATAGGVAFQILLSRQLGTIGVGLFFLAAKIAFLPNEIAAQVVGAVAFPVYARVQTNVDALAGMCRTLLRGVTLLLVPASILMIVVAPALVAHVLGAKWEPAVPVLRILTLAGLISLLDEATVPVLKGLGRPSHIAVLETVKSVIKVLLIVPLTARYGLSGAAWAWLVAMTASQLLSVAYLYRFVRAPLAGWGRLLGATVTATTAGGLVAGVAVRLVPGPAGLFAALAGGGLVIITGLWVLDRRLLLGMTATLPTGVPVLDFTGARDAAARAAAVAMTRGSAHPG